MTTAPHATEGSPDGFSRGPDTDSECVARKAMLCQHISQVLGIQLLRIMKVSGTEPIYLMDLEEGRIQFEIDKLMSQRSVSLALAAKVGKVIRGFTRIEWRNLSQMILDACITQEGTDDLTLEGEARIYLSRYLSEVQFVESPARQPADARYRPMIYNGRIVVSSMDMQLYINRTMSQSRSVKSIAAMLAALGSESVRVRGNDFREQGRWALPLDEFPPKDYQRQQEDARGDE
jgi:hypothetical protein